MANYTLRAAAGAIFVTRSGTTYTANPGGFVLNVPAGNDLVDLIANGCKFLPALSLLPWVTGRFYGVPRGSTQAAVLTVLGTIYAYPIFISGKVTVASLNVNVTTGTTGGKARGALFYDVDGYPGAIVPGTDTGDLDASSTALVSKTGLTAVLDSGWYWYGSIYTASSTMPQVSGSTAIYASTLNAMLGSDTAAHALTASGEAGTGIAKTGQTYPATDMTTSFPVFPTGAALTLNATTPIVAVGV